MKRLIFISSFIFIFNYTFAQSEDEKAIKSVVMQLFEGIRMHDSTLLKNTFYPSARIQTIGFNRTTSSNVLNTENKIDNFIKQICRNSINIQMREVPKSFEFRIDNQLATVWAPYEFYIKELPTVDEHISHNGVDSFQLYKTVDGWKILSLVYTIHRLE